MRLRRRFNFWHKLAVPQELKNKEHLLPNFITQNPYFQQQTEIKKVFPAIGLSNFEEETDVKISSNAEEIKPIIREVFAQIQHVINVTLDHIELQLIVKNLQDVDFQDTINDFYILLIKIIKALDMVSYTQDPNTHKFNLLINLHESLKIKIKNQSFTITSSENIFRIYQKINKIIEAFNNVLTQKIPLMINLDRLESVKKFHDANISNKKYKIVFSSSGEQGAWDILTMSERGFSSCQSWDDLDDYKEALIGSLFSKFVGIIYLTSGHQIPRFGDKFVKRCIVRFGLDFTESTKGKPTVLLDRMYPTYDKHVEQVFLNALQKRTKFPVKSLQTGGEFKLLDRRHLPVDIRLPYSDYSSNLPTKQKEEKYLDRDLLLSEAHQEITYETDQLQHLLTTEEMSKVNTKIDSILYNLFVQGILEQYFRNHFYNHNKTLTFLLIFIFNQLDKFIASLNTPNYSKCHIILQSSIRILKREIIN